MGMRVLFSTSVRLLILLFKRSNKIKMARGKPSPNNNPIMEFILVLGAVRVALSARAGSRGLLSATLEALAMVVTYEVETKITKKTKAGEKDYYTCRRKEIKARIEEHMELLVDLGYLKEYRAIDHGDKTYEFWYKFGEKMGIITTHTLKLKQKEKAQLENKKKS